MGTLLASYKRLLKHDADAAGSDEVADEGGDRLEADPDHIGPLTADVPERPLRCSTTSGTPSTAWSTPAVQAGIRRWLTDMRPALLTSYENYQNLRAVMWPEWEARPARALLFGIMARSPTTACMPPRAPAPPA